MIYLHIGLHKTGTSTIQRFAAGNVDLLARYGVLYPQIGRQAEAHHQLMKDARGEADTRLVDELADFVRAHDDQNVLISAEGLSTLLGPAVQRFVEPLTKVADIRVLLYVRSAAVRLVSSYNQVTKRSLNVSSFDEFFRFRASGRDIDHHVQNWGAAVGYDALRVRTIEPAALVSGDLLTDFCAALGIGEEAIRDADPASMERVNVGVPWEVAEYVREFGLRAAALLGGLRPKQREQLAEASRPQASIVQARSTTTRGRGSEKVATLRLRNLEEVCQTALEAQGKGERVQYMTPEQSEIMEARYQTLLDHVAARVPDAKLPHAPPAPLPPRPFEPSFAHIAPERLAAIHAALARDPRFKKLAPEIPAIFDDIRGGRATG